MGILLPVFSKRRLQQDANWDFASSETAEQEMLHHRNTLPQKLFSSSCNVAGAT